MVFCGPAHLILEIFVLSSRHMFS